MIAYLQDYWFSIPAAIIIIGLLLFLWKTWCDVYHPEVEEKLDPPDEQEEGQQ